MNFSESTRATSDSEESPCNQLRCRKKHARARSACIDLDSPFNVPNPCAISQHQETSPSLKDILIPISSKRRTASCDGTGSNLLVNASRAVEQAEEFMMQLWENVGWRVVHFKHLPDWLRDNEYLLWGHRPQLATFNLCFRSIFRIHTETGNIWTHLLGCVGFFILCICFLVHRELDLPWEETFAIIVFFISAILALGFSWTFHTFSCHSEHVGRLFCKLDYIGITVLVIGSFVPWIHFSFYCHVPSKIVYLSGITILGIICMVISSQDHFRMPRYRGVRAGLFIALGLSAVVPFIHYIILEGLSDTISISAVSWLVLMAFLYIAGALIYAYRIPERLCPGKFDIWFQSHQIFHVCVVLAALVHLKSVLEIAQHRNSKRDCIISP